jgi:molybdopterin-guanine dinucleotide biosynthesis protein A
MSLSVAPLYGLVLAGGRSRRMGRDKSVLAYRQDERGDGVPHARYTGDLLARVCERVFYSCRADQVGNAGDPALAGALDGFDLIPDVYDIGGPLNGILSAQKAHPEAAFLVAACDLPFLTAYALAQLVRERNPGHAATVFENPERQALEPLCAIYEPGFEDLAEASMRIGLTCPTKILSALFEGGQVELLRPASAEFLENANRPEDYERALAQLSAAGGSARD